MQHPCTLGRGLPNRRSVCTSTSPVHFLVHMVFPIRLCRTMGLNSCPAILRSSCAAMVSNIRISPYHPSSNGAIERFVCTFKVAMKAGWNDGLTPQHRLEKFLLTYHSTPHATTGVAPCSLFLGQTIRMRFDLVKPNVEERVLQKQAMQKRVVTSTGVNVILRLDRKSL